MTATGFKTIKLEVRADCSRYADDGRQRTMDKEAERLEHVINGVLSLNGYFDYEVSVAASRED